MFIRLSICFLLFIHRPKKLDKKHIPLDMEIYIYANDERPVHGGKRGVYSKLPLHVVVYQSTINSVRITPGGFKLYSEVGQGEHCHKTHPLRHITPHLDHALGQVLTYFDAPLGGGLRGAPPPCLEPWLRLSINEYCFHWFASLKGLFTIFSKPHSRLFSVSRYLIYVYCIGYEGSIRLPI